MSPPTPLEPPGGKGRADAPAPLGAGLEPGAKRLLKVAMAALARREHSRAEIERKLAQKISPQDSGQDVAEVLRLLQERGLQSDRRMAEALVRTRGARYGRRRISQELERRGVDRETIAAVLPPLESEIELARAIWRRKFGKAPASLQERARQSRFLAARGFSSGVIGRVIGAEDDGPA